MRVLVSLALIGAAGCAGASATGSAPVSQTAVLGSDVRMAPNIKPYTMDLGFPVAKVWASLPFVYDSLGLPLTVMDNRQHLIGNQGMKIRQKLKGVALSKYIDCGAAQIGASADSYEVFLSVTTTLSTTPTGTHMVTILDSSAKPITFSQEYARCNTTGELETRIQDLVKAAMLH